ncbi:uncharacterized protein J4E88_002740 [Alternaria novae-zelandiae]|uniref:uncharacterized protein n=1 Tax=Alternaria novae-zelandiae TaxID=430562 RepID=UPI0020C47DE2|nr:uncharacterized protein J4E88_002740 [Alternaria novae-zelandiae]KAI4689388.1 hypothetical protein J4E88_002740 [Alternaria novae-zelandiae]
MKPNRQGIYGFVKNSDVQPLLKSELRGLASVKDRLAEATVVAFDIEGVHQRGSEASELGVAVLRPSSKPLRFFSSMYHFYNQNEIEAFTIRIQERRYGPVVGTMTDETKETAGARLYKFLSSIQGELILVGFGMTREFKWISDEFPAIAALFTSWCDVQELVSDYYKSMTAEPDKLLIQYHALDEFIAKVHGSLYEGVKLFVTPMAPPNKYLAAKRSNEMPWKQPRTVSRYDGDDLIAAFE